MVAAQRIGASSLLVSEDFSDVLAEFRATLSEQCCKSWDSTLSQKCPPEVQRAGLVVLEAAERAVHLGYSGDCPVVFERSDSHAKLVCCGGSASSRHYGYCCTLISRFPTKTTLV